MKANVLGLGRIVVAGTVLLTAAMAWGGPGNKTGQRRVALEREGDSRGASFSRSATFTGILAKTITIGTTQYRISPKATIYVVGKGVVDPGFAVFDAHLYLTGRRVGSEVMVTQILVRTKNASDRGEKGEVGELPPGEPS